MEDIIRKTNFFNATENDAEAFREKLDNDHFDELNVGQLNRVLDVLAEKLKTDKWPSRNEPGGGMLEQVCYRIRNSAR